MRVGAYNYEVFFCNDRLTVSHLRFENKDDLVEWAFSQSVDLARCILFFKGFLLSDVDCLMTSVVARRKRFEG